MESFNSTQGETSTSPLDASHTMREVRFIPHSFKNYSIYYDENSHNKALKQFQETNDIQTSRIYYKSDGLNVNGLRLQPKDPPKKSLPLFIYNRGGNREFCKLDLGFTLKVLMPFVRKILCLLLASNYRGNDGGEGKEDFGGKDVNDVHALIETGKQDTLWDGKNIFMFGYSSGGIRTYKLLSERKDITAAAIQAAPVDLFSMAVARPEMDKYVFSELAYEKPGMRDSALRERSPMFYADRLNVSVQGIRRSMAFSETFVYKNDQFYLKMLPKAREFAHWKRFVTEKREKLATLVFEHMIP